MRKYQRTKSGPGKGYGIILALLLSLFSANIAVAAAVVDIMLVYDTTATTWVNSNGGMTVFSQDAVTRMNQAMQNSGISHSFRLVHSMSVNYTTTSDDSTPFNGDLTALETGTGEFAAVHTARETYKADLVAMLVDTGSAYGYVGLGNLLTAWTGVPNACFTVNAIQSVNISQTLTHEVGHNLGAHHSKNQLSSPGPNVYLDNQYSAGWYFTGTNSSDYHTVMAYNNDGYGNSYISAPLFSTPLITYQGTSAGHALDGDNTRLINLTIPTVAGYRNSGAPLTGLTISGPIGVNENRSATYTATASWSDGSTSTVTPTWGEDSTYTTISATGVLTTSSVSSDQTVTISASYSSGSVTKTDTHIVTLLDGPSLGEAVDNTSLTWTTGGSADWFGQSSTTFYDGDAAQSDNIPDNQTSYMQTTVPGDGTISFYWKISSEVGYDYLRFYIDDVEQAGSISGSTNWALKTFTIAGAGLHTLKWAYIKDDSVSSGSDSGWVDKVVWVASTTLTGLTISGSTGVDENNSATYTATASWSDGSTSTVTPIWGENSTYTTISAAGVLTTSSIPSDQTVTISASYTSGGVTKTDTHIVTLLDVPPTLTGLTISGSTSVDENSSATYTATASWSDGTTSTVTPTWGEDSTYTTISAAGVLTTSSVPSDQTVTISASYTSGGITSTDTHIVTLLDVPPTLTGLTISGSTGVDENSSATYTATASWSDGTTSTVTPTWGEDSAYTTISAAGVLTTSSIPFDQTVTISASYTSGGVTSTDTHIVTVMNIPSLGEAVDNTILTWATGGSADWFGQSTTVFYGGDAAQSGNIADNQISYMQTTVSGDSTISFYWKVSSEAGDDYLRFYIDDVEQTGSISGSTDWTLKTFTIAGAGLHTLKWTYTKSSSISSGSDCGWVDVVVWPAGEPDFPWTMFLPTIVD